ncbi:MAG: transketolase family protein [Clostridia bacterium]|nr:transketolase family protein [Clostridia bacterium]MBQ4543728.1 transketolase family protein [Clostridia bacterium]
MSNKMATREAYGKKLAMLGETTDIIVMDADLSGSTKTGEFAKKFPEKFINTGIAEGNMMSTAAGIATTGKTVFASSFAMFAAGRAFEQIRNSICYPKLNVKIGATHAGISVGEDGATHQSIEDIAVMRSVPNMVVLSPVDQYETYAVIDAAVKYNGPVYIRLARLPIENIYDENYTFEIGKSHTLKDGDDVTIIATGIMVGASLEAVNMLKEQGINARLINMASIKPIDKDAIIKAAKETKAIVTVEEHSIIGGLGSAVCEVLCECEPVKVKRIGVEDRFGQSGKPELLFEEYGLTAENIVKQTMKLLGK